MNFQRQLPLYLRSSKNYIFCLMMISLPFLAFAEDNESVRELGPQQHDKVKSIGRAILQSKRSYQPDLQVLQLRKQVTEIHSLLDRLTAPVVSKIHVIDPTTASNLSTASVKTTWQQNNRTDIDRLHQVSNDLSTLCRTLREKHYQTANLGIFESIKQYFFSSGAPDKPHVVTPISNAALAQLEKIDIDITNTLALPATERYAQLIALRDTLQFNAQFNAAKEITLTAESQTSPPTPPTPTFVNRTQHRRDRR